MSYCGIAHPLVELILDRGLTGDPFSRVIGIYNLPDYHD
jgi:hypothetical protein